MGIANRVELTIRISQYNKRLRAG